MGRGLEPAAEILLLREQVAQSPGDRRVVAGEADLEEGVDELARRVDGTRAGLRVPLVPAAGRVLEREQGAGLAPDLVGVLLPVDQPPGVEAMDPVLQGLDPPVGGP